MELILKELVKATSFIKGTTLITYCVSGLTSIEQITKTLISEIASAQNIKSKQVRNSVITSLKMLSEHVPNHIMKGKTPSNGLVMLCGQINENISQYL